MDEELQEMIAGFVEDCREGFESMEEDLMAMEDNSDDPTIMNNLFRVMHTLKGTAGFMGLNDIQSFSHKLESAFDLIRQNQITMTPRLLDFLLPSIDKLKDMVFGQIGECEIPEVSEDLKTLDQIIESRSDAAILGSSIDTKVLKKAEKPKPTTDIAPETLSSNDTGSSDEIDFDAILTEYGGDVPIPTTIVPNLPKIKISKIEIPPLQTAPPEESSPELLQQFVIESEEHLEVIEENLLSLENNSEDTEKVNSFFRAIHSIKGTAGYVHLKQIEALSHGVETIFDCLRKGEFKYTKEIGDIVFKSIDMLRTLVFYIKINDYSQTLDVSDQLYQLAAIALGESPKDAKPPEQIETQDVDGKLSTFLKGAQQQLEVLVLYQGELDKGALNEHDLITLHRSLKTLHAGANYCGLADLESSIMEYEEILLKILGGEIEQTEDTVNNMVKPAHKKIIKEVDKLQATGKKATPPEVAPSQPESPPPVVEKIKPASEIKRESESVPVVVETKSKTLEISDTEKAQKRAGRSLTNELEGPGVNEKNKTPESKTMRVDASRLDHFMNLISELIIARNAFKHLADTMDDESNIKDIIQNIKQIENSISRISDNLQDNLMEMRLVKVKTIFQRMPRIVRDISRKTNKKIVLRMEGETTEVDKSIVEEIGDPLVHIIRNSCDHGIESSEKRLTAGKTEQGTITLKAGHLGSFILIEIIDDGGGIDPIMIKKAAVKKGVIIQDQANEMSDHDAVNLIFAPGFSTAEEVSDISGRGVGMDVVMSNIRNIQGSVEVVSEVGKGTHITLKLPLTLAVIEALVVGVNGASYAIPLDAIKETVSVYPDTLKKLKGKLAIEIRGEIIGVTPLTELLQLEPVVEEVNDDDEIMDEAELKKVQLPIVILNVNDHEIGIAVDRMYNQQEVVVKPLEDYLSVIPGLKGSTIMGDGQVVLILEPYELMELATSI